MPEYKLPDPGEGLTEAEIVSWKVKVGDTVKINDIVVEIETAKSLVELPSPYAGTVSALLVQEGETVEVGTPIIAIGDPAAPPAETPARPAAPSGEVTVTGWVRVDATGDSAQVADQSTRAISSRTIGPTLPFPVYGGFVELDTETSPPAEPLEKVETPDLVAELADFLIPLDGVHSSLVMGRHEGRLYLSLRSRDDARDAGSLIQRVVGDMGTAGGHGRMAGAQIPLEGRDEEPGSEVRRRFLRELGLDPDAAGEALVRSGGAAQSPSASA